MNISRFDKENSLGFSVGVFAEFYSQLVALYERLFLAEDCLLPRLAGGPLTRKLSLKIDESAARSDPQRTLRFRISVAASQHKAAF